METINNKLKVLSKLRETVNDLNQKKKDAFEIFEKEHKQLFDDIRRLSEAINLTESHIRTQALIKFKETNLKKFDNGIEIKFFTTYDYDEKDALVWCKEHSMALKVDVAAFKKIMKADSANMIFVKVDEEPRATIPTKIDLTKLCE